jgi:hypothetical protein
VFFFSNSFACLVKLQTSSSSSFCLKTCFNVARHVHVHVFSVSLFDICAWCFWHAAIDFSFFVFGSKIEKSYNGSR